MLDLFSYVSELPNDNCLAFLVIFYLAVYLLDIISFTLSSRYSVSTDINITEFH